MYDIPMSYDMINMIHNVQSPSGINVENTALNWFFERYLMQKAFYRFDIRLPKNWIKDYFRYVLFIDGHIAVVKTDKFGVIPQRCTLEGFGVQYQPLRANISNHLLSGILTPTIGTECTVIKLTPDYLGIWDMISYYANLMSIAASTAGMNLINSKLSYVFFAENPAAAESFKKLFSDIASGKPASVIDKKLLNEDGRPAWDLFTQNVKQNYITGDVLADLRKIECEFDTKIGIPNANTDKRERLISDEVNANNVETDSLCQIWFDELQQGFEETRQLFGYSEEDLSITLKEVNDNVRDITGTL